jgi:uncharacterized protein (UPF0276 family)
VASGVGERVELAVNYSLPAAELLREERIRFDRFKCPAWPDLVATAGRDCPTYVHFPLGLGAGSRGAIDVETGQPADWAQVETLMAQTGTPLVNLHLTLTVKDYPDIPIDTRDPTHVEMLTGRLIEGVRTVVERFGPERVIVENVHHGRGRHLLPPFLPQTICRVVEETGCGFLFDLSHACLAAQDLGVDVYEYVGALPVERIREIHISGIQRFEGRWVELVRQAGLDDGLIQRYAGWVMDHLPMTGADWAFFEWAMGQVHSGAWARPWVVTFEYGGVSPPWEAITDADALAEQVPRLRAMVRGQ